MRDAPKHVKRLLREYAGQAHEEELRRALLPLAESFRRWERGELGSGELCDLIHDFHQGPAREIWKRYNTGYQDMNVAYAIATGLLDRQRVPAELLEHLARPLAFYEEQDRQPDRGPDPAG